MVIPPSIDPATVTTLIVNTGYFNPGDSNKAIAQLAHAFPNADISIGEDEECPELPILHLETQPQLSDSDRTELLSALDESLPHGVWHGWDLGGLRTEDGDPVWKGKGPAPSYRETLIKALEIRSQVNDSADPDAWLEGMERDPDAENVP